MCVLSEVGREETDRGERTVANNKKQTGCRVQFLQVVKDYQTLSKQGEKYGGLLAGGASPLLTQLPSGENRLTGALWGNTKLRGHSIIGVIALHFWNMLTRFSLISVH